RTGSGPGTTATGRRGTGRTGGPAPGCAARPRHRARPRAPGASPGRPGGTLEPVAGLADGRLVDPALLEQRRRHALEQRAVAPRADREVLISLGGRRRAARVDDRPPGAAPVLRSE